MLRLLPPILLLFLAIACSPSPKEPPPMPSPLTRQQMIGRVVAGAPVFACPAWSDWFTKVKSQAAACPEPVQRVVNVRAGRANLDRGGFIALREYPTEKK